MAPFIAALLGAAGVGGAYLLFKKPTPPAPPNIDPNKAKSADTLTKGKSYAVLAMNDWTKMPGAISPGGGGYQTPDKDGNARYIKAVFENVGFKVLSEPQLRDNAEAAKFYSGQPALWVFNAQWTKDEKFVTLEPAALPIFPMTMFYPLGVS